MTWVDCKNKCRFMPFKFHATATVVIKADLVATVVSAFSFLGTNSPTL